jgi:hypothetical protein
MLVRTLIQIYEIFIRSALTYGRESEFKKTDVRIEDFITSKSGNSSRATSRVNSEQKTNWQARKLKFFLKRLIIITDYKKPFFNVFHVRATK